MPGKKRGSPGNPALGARMEEIRKPVYPNVIPLARKMHIKPDILRKIERGRLQPWDSDIENFCVVLELSQKVKAELFELQHLKADAGISERSNVGLAEFRLKSLHTPDPPAWFHRYRLGNIDLPVMILFGSPEQPFSLDEVTITYDPTIFHEQSSYPSDLASAKPHLLEAFYKEYGRHHTDNPIPRFCGYTQAGESSDDIRGNVTLHFMQTSYFTFLATNRSLDKAVIPCSGTNKTIREAYITYPYTLESSVLSNPVGVQVVVISRNPNQSPADQVIIRLRSKQLALHRNCYQPSAAGGMALATDHFDTHHMPNPFFTARKEAQQEIADRLILQPGDYQLIGMAIRWEDMEPNAYGYAETTQPVRDLLGDFRRDAYEGLVESIPFDPHTVLNHMSEHRWEAVGALAMCAALLAHFPRKDVEAVARQIPKKDYREYFEHRSN